MKNAYQIIDNIWGAVSKLVFVRFQFEIPTEELKELQKKGRIIFAVTSGGVFEWLIMSSWCRTQNLGVIYVANRKTILILSKPILFLKVIFGKLPLPDLFNSAESGPRIMFCPTNERKQLFKPTPVEHLIAKLHEQSIEPEGTQFFIVPVLILWRKYTRGERRRFDELLLGISSNPNWIGKFWYLLRKRQDSNVKSLGFLPVVEREPFLLGETPDEIDEGVSLKIARVLRRKIIVLIQQEMRVVLGPRYLSPTSVKETLIRDEEVQKAIHLMAEKEGLDNKKVMMLAYQYLTEIVASYTYRIIEILAVFLGWLFTRVFEGLVVQSEEISKVREVMKTKPIVFVSCHRSHLDYLVVPYVLFTEDMLTPHIAAGVNLSFWPVGYFLRKSGAFFIRRSFKGNDLYALLLKKYIEFLLKNRHNVKFFIEGTRSRSGKMLPPAFGILKMILEIYRNKGTEDIALIPVSISYDEVLEEGSYSKELRGGKKEKETATGLFKSRKITKKNIGKVYVRFADALSVKEIIQKADENNVEARRTLQKTAFQLCKTINDVSPITPKSIVSSIFLTHRDLSLPFSEVLRISDRMADYVIYSGMSLSTPQESGFRSAVESTVRGLQKKGFLLISESLVREYSLEHKKRAVLNFYKNNAIHCFVIPSICVLAFLDTLKKRRVAKSNQKTFYDDFITNALVLRNILKFEFFFSPRIIFPSELTKTLQYFSPDCPWESADDQVWTDGFHHFFKDWDEATVYSGLIGELLESYLILMSFLKEQEGQTFDKKQCLNRLIKYGEAKKDVGDIAYPESISIQNFTNGLLSCVNKGYLSSDSVGDKTVLNVLPSTLETEKMIKDIQDYLTLLTERPSVIVAS